MENAIRKEEGTKCGRNVQAVGDLLKFIIMKKWIKDAVIRTEKALLNDRLRVSKVSWKFHVSTIYNYALIYSWNLLFS